MNQNKEMLRDKPATGHNHTYYSLNDSTQSPDEYVARCKEMGFASVALNDHGTLLGVHPFMDACKKHDINGIPGVEAYSKVCAEVLERLSGYADMLGGRTHLIINPMNYKGYQTISYALRDANQHIEYLLKLVYPIMTCDILEKHFAGSGDIFATSACAQGAVGYILQTNLRIQRKLEKEYAVCNEQREDYEKTLELACKVKELSELVKEKKKEQTEWQRYTKAAHARKIKRLQESANSDQMSLFEENNANEKDELAEAIRLKEETPEKIIQIQEEVERLQKEQDDVKKEAKQCKARSSKYLKAMEKIKMFPPIPEDELYECAKIQLLYYKSIFQNFFIELQYHGIKEEAYIMPILLRLADETQTPIIAANDAHVSRNSEDCFMARNIVRYNYFENAQTIEPADRELYVKSDRELVEALSKVIPKERAVEAVMGTDVFNQCHVVFPNEEHYPSVDSGESMDDLLAQKKKEMQESGQWNEIYEKRLQHETQVIKKMGYVDYHMVVRDLCNAARKIGKVPKEDLHNMPEDFGLLDQWMKERGYESGVGVGPGRGSAAGSLVCYMLGITNIDPVKYNLLFERFLNPERVSMPDIDSDIKTSIRPYVIKYAKWKFGEMAVCSICTETTYAAKGAVQMAGRERASRLYPGKDKLQERRKYMYGTTLKISDMVPELPNVTLAEYEDEFKNAFAGNKEAEVVWNHAKLIEGKVKGTGIHAGGVVISDNHNVNEYIALAWNEENQVWVAQCDMGKIEEIGMLKIDLLGLSTLDFTSDCMHLIKKYHNVDIDIDNIPHEKEVFAEIYTKGNTNSVFQYESSGMKSMLKEFKPESLEDLILLVACYRPGPMQYLNDIIAVKNGQKEVSYKTPELEHILSTTYGAIVYQEQVMQIFQDLAGYSLGAADMVRRAMSKKKLDKLEVERESFIYGSEKRGIDGCIKRGIKESVANQLFDEMIDFAKYAFNKSHAACYAVVSYQTAWLKYHYPAEYICAVLCNREQDKFAPLYADCETYGIKVLPPDINKSYFDFVIEDGNIRYGFGGIKSIGEAMQPIFANIVKEREKRDYDSVQDFLKRNLIVKDGKVSMIQDKVLKILAESGCFDCFGHNRKELSAAFDSFSIELADGENAEESAKRSIDGMQIPDEPKDMSDNMAKEMHYLGTILCENPLDGYQSDEAYGCTPIEELKPGRASIFGLVTSVESKKSSKGNNMLLMQVKGKRGNCTVMAMNALYDEYANKLDQLEQKVIKISGSVNDGGSMFANRISGISASNKMYFIDLTSEMDTRFLMEMRKEVPEDERDIKIQIQFHWNKKGGQLVEALVPKINHVMFSKSEFDKIKKRGMKIESWK